MQNSCTPLKGEYSENLSHGGKLKVTITSWHIYYYFPGPDGRYSGTSVIIYDKEIDLFISAWKNNFNKYRQLKEVIPQGGNSEYPGKMGMSIRFGFCEGVCIKSYHLPIKTQKELDSIISEYTDVKLKALQIQQVLKGNN